MQHYLWSADLSKSFSQLTLSILLILSIFILSQYLLQVWDNPTLLALSFISFKDRYVRANQQNFADKN